MALVEHRAITDRILFQPDKGASAGKPPENERDGKPKQSRGNDNVPPAWRALTPDANRLYSVFDETPKPPKHPSQVTTDEDEMPIIQLDALFNPKTNRWETNTINEQLRKLRPQDVIMTAILHAIMSANNIHMLSRRHQKGAELLLPQVRGLEIIKGNAAADTIGSFIIPHSSRDERRLATINTRWYRATEELKGMLDARWAPIRERIPEDPEKISEVLPEILRQTTVDLQTVKDQLKLTDTDISLGKTAVVTANVGAGTELEIGKATEVFGPEIDVSLIGAPGINRNIAGIGKVIGHRGNPFASIDPILFQPNSTFFSMTNSMFDFNIADRIAENAQLACSNAIKAEQFQWLVVNLESITLRGIRGLLRTRPSDQEVEQIVRQHVQELVAQDPYRIDQMKLAEQMYLDTMGLATMATVEWDLHQTKRKERNVGVPTGSYIGLSKIISHFHAGL